MFPTCIYFLGSASSSVLVETIPVDGQGYSLEAMEETAWPFISGLGDFALGALFLLSIVCDTGHPRRVAVQLHPGQLLTTENIQ